MHMYIWFWLCLEKWYQWFSRRFSCWFHIIKFLAVSLLVESCKSSFDLFPTWNSFQKIFLYIRTLKHPQLIGIKISRCKFLVQILILPECYTHVGIVHLRLSVFSNQVGDKKVRGGVLNSSALVQFNSLVDYLLNVVIMIWGL